MKSESLVCICIPNYNNEKTISATLDSLVNQTYKNIIIKIFDNASTDNSVKILREYEVKYSHIQVFQNEKNIGGEANFTKCIENMEGEFGAIYHADDEYMIQMVEEQVNVLQNNQNLVGVSTNAYKIDLNSNILGNLYKLPKEMLQSELYIFNSQIELLKTTINYGNLIVCPSVMGRIKVYKENIKKWNSKEYKTSADLDVWLRFCEFGEFGYIIKPLMKYRVSTVSYSYNLSRVRTHRHDFFLVVDEYMNRYNMKKDINYKNYLERYKLLSFKDSLNIEINKIIQNRESRFLNILKYISLRELFAFNRNLKTLVLYLIYSIFYLLPKNNFMRKILYKIRFK